MGDVKQFPNLQAELRDAMVAGLRLQADAIEQGIDDFDGLVLIGYYRETEEVEPFPIGLKSSELSWAGLQLQNWALSEHYESFSED